MKALLRLVVTLVMLAVPVGLVLMLRAAGVKSPPYVPPKRVNVEVSTVRRETLDDVVSLPVAVEAKEDGFVRVSAEISGAVTWIGRKEGETVAAGEAVVRIDTERLVAELATAKASWVEAKQKYDRVNQLCEGGHISKDQLDTARAALDRAAAGVQMVEVTVKKGTVASPIGGTVDRRYVSEGEYVTPGTRLFDVVDVQRLYAVVDVPERDRQFMVSGMTMALTFENVVSANPGRAFLVPEAVVRSVGDMAASSTRTYRAKVEFANPQGLVKPGMLGTARIRRRVIPNVVVLHRDVIVASESEKLVYVAVDGKAVARRVDLGFTDGERFAVLRGLEGGERVIRNPRQLTPGQPIRVRSIDGEPTADEPDVPAWDPRGPVETTEKKAGQP